LELCNGDTIAADTQGGTRDPKRSSETGAERLADAKALLSQKRWAGAYYLSGYAVECGLKACIAKRTVAEDFPDKGFADKCWTHDLDRLVAAGGLKTRRESDAAADSDFSDNWTTVTRWDEASRYARMGKVDAEELYEAIIDKKHGVMPWIRLHW
jgi:HEPN domain-containing protein